MSLISQIESLLFVSHSPLSVEQLKKLTKHKKKEVEDALVVLEKKYKEQKESGMVLLKTSSKYQLVTHPDNAKLIQSYLKSDITGELTDPALETLTIIAYRGPITKPEIEHIRGVNCSLILRNLLIRGLVEKEEGSSKDMPRYSVTADFLKFLGVTETAELPEYEKLSEHETLEQVLQAVDAPEQSET